jgi:hypothetical protein
VTNAIQFATRILSGLIIRKRIKSFWVGDKTLWESGDHGTYQIKLGTIVGIVPQGKLPSRNMFYGLYQFVRGWDIRNHQSYVIRVDKRNYWPDVKDMHKLRIVDIEKLTKDKE